MVNPDTHSLIEIFLQLSPADEELMVSMPYRIGLYISHADVTGGWDAQDSEIQSLTGILRDYSTDFCKTELSQKVLMDCLASRAKWPSWSHDVDQVPVQIGQIITTLESMLSEKELRGFCDVLTDIGLAVAMAFREGGAEAGARPLVHEILSRLGTVLSEKDPLGHMNISEAERSALKKITRALRYSKLEG